MGNCFCPNPEETHPEENAKIQLETKVPPSPKASSIPEFTLEQHLNNQKHEKIPALRYLPHHFENSWSKVTDIMSNPPTNMEAFDSALSKLDSVASKTNATSLTPSKKPKPGFYSNALNLLFQQESDLKSIFFSEIIPHMCKTVLNIPTLFENPYVEVLITRKEGTREYSRAQAHALLCCQFFNLISHVELLRDCTFWYILNQDDQLFKLRCIFNYFLCVARGVGPKSGSIVIRRHFISVQEIADSFSHSSLETKLEHVFPMLIGTGTIEEQENCAHTDFANRAIGGGVLRGGCVQEEIMFMICPECLISMIMCPVMTDNEAITIRGFTQYSSYTGYARKTKWKGTFGETVNDDPEETCAIDALQFPHFRQYRPAYGIRREIVKAFVGFRDLTHDTVATGNWGSGAFGGDPQLKFFLQWIAASLAEKKVIYCKFNDRRMESLKEIIEATPKTIKVGQLYKVVLAVCERSGLADGVEDATFFDTFLQLIRDGEFCQRFAIIPVM